jgi:ComF family protein
MRFVKDLIAVFYPEVCLSCHETLTTNEKVVCIGCRHDLPFTKFSFEPANLVEKTFYGRIPIEQGTALFYFHKKGHVQELIHSLKYRNHQQVGALFGGWLGDELIESCRFSTIDCIIPVPLHPKKLKKRGYNQVTTFGKSLSNKLGIPFIENILKKVSATNTQTRKLRFDRWKNAHDLFVVENNNLLENKHILLIDDIITTGATLEACCEAFKKTKNLKISIACMAYTK